VPLLAPHGIQLEVRPFLTNRTFDALYDRAHAMRIVAGIGAGIARRSREMRRLDTYDVVFVQREAALVGPPVIERAASRRRPLVLDLDDATYYEHPSHVFGAIASTLKWRGKTDQLIRWSTHVVCGNPAIASYVARLGIPTTVQPTLVDVDHFTPRAERAAGEVVIGWVGTQSTYGYFKVLLPVLRRLATAHQFRVRVVGGGPEAAGVKGIESIRWSLEREVQDLQSFDIGVYPIPDDAWAMGKSGLKAIQYLSCGIPYVASPVGVVAELGVPGTTHFEGRTEDEWYHALARLLGDAGLRAEMGRRGREYAVRHFSTRNAAAMLADLFFRVAGGHTALR
jgi:glycosyltransferase involved in cell wall biosynthesis